MRGRFITFEGIDGAGKSSHIDACAMLLRQRGLTALCTREPGGTDLAEAIRHWVLSEPMSMQVETLLVFAARQDHVDRVIEPALARGDWVICDRFTDSTVAYQGGGRGMPLPRIEALEAWVHEGLQPDRTYLFDLAPEVAAARRAAVRAADRFEAQDLVFFQQVRAAYLDRAQRFPDRFRLIDAAQAPGEIKKQLEKDLSSI